MDDLPKFEEGKLYLLTAATVKALEDAIRRGRPRATTGGGLQTSEQGSDGTFLSLTSPPAPAS